MWSTHAVSYMFYQRMENVICRRLLFHYFAQWTPIYISIGLIFFYKLQKKILIFSAVRSRCDLILARNSLLLLLFFFSCYFYASECFWFKECLSGGELCVFEWCFWKIAQQWNVDLRKRTHQIQDYIKFNTHMRNIGGWRRQIGLIFDEIAFI